MWWANTPYFGWFQNIPKKLWKLSQIFEMQSLADDFFFFKFSFEEDFESILHSSWTIGGRPLIHRKRHPGICPTHEMLKSVPIWIRFQELPIQYFEDESLLMLTRSLGIPIFVDRATMNRTQLAFAWVYLEIDHTFISYIRSSNPQPIGNLMLKIPYISLWA